MRYQGEDGEAWVPVTSGPVGVPGTGGGGGEFPDAPNNGISYGRKNLAWVPVLALSGDVLDGGNY